jgi:histone demethylase JARID1
MSSSNSNNSSTEPSSSSSTTSIVDNIPHSNNNSTATSSSTSGDIKEVSGFNEAYYRESPWNLTNFPVCESSLLKYINTPIVGVTVPWLYIGMLFTSFCWHNEDNYMYSVNYSHLGATKQWYGVPASEAKKFERVSRESFFESFEDSPDLLYHMTTQISPSLLITKDVSVYRAQQEARCFIITFPQAYHCGFSYGFNIGEAVNFAPVDWLGFGTEAEESYRLLGRETVISNQRMMFTLLHHLNEVTLSRALMETFARDIIRIADEELLSRQAIRGAGVKDWSEANIPKNNFTSITKKDLDYDELKTCSFCKYICVFTAVACKCNTKKVACVRHFRDMCKQNKCSVEKRFMLCTYVIV